MSVTNQMPLGTGFASNPDYIQCLTRIKEKVARCQAKGALSANREWIHFYFDLGRMIAEKQWQSSWGDKVIDRLSGDIKRGQK